MAPDQSGHGRAVKSSGKTVVADALIDLESDLTYIPSME
jgi:hypothetical protein